MSANSARFLTQLLEHEENTVEAVEIELACNKELSLEQRNTMLNLQATYERLCDQLSAAIQEYDFTEELPSKSRNHLE